jgi:uroporphyrinogen-III synthase
MPRKVSCAVMIRPLPDPCRAGNTAGMVIQSRPMHLLLTRPRPQSARFARQVRSGLDLPPHVTIAPLIKPVFLHPTLPTASFQAVIFTSETGVAASASYTSLPKRAYCVGDQTARAARRAGFAAQSSAGDAEALLRMLMQGPPHGPLLHICGVDTRGDISERLNFAGVETHVAIAYQQVATALTPAAVRLLSGGDPVVIPLFSPRTAQLFAAAAEPTATVPLYITAFSAAVAQALGGLRIAGLEIAPQPTAEAMITAIRRIADRLRTA